MSSFAAFLARNAVVPGGTLPLVQTRAAYHLAKIIDSQEIAPEPCDVFAPDRLNYFFVGRPAYKFPIDQAQPAYWELPICFIFEFGAIGPIKRIFPFDSGAHHLGLYPNYVQVIGKDQFDVASVPEAPARIIGAYFKSARDYFDLKPKDQSEFEAEHALGALDAEVRAIHRLASIPSPGGFDDRRLAIEIQSQESVDLTVTKPLAVVLPHIYMDTLDVRRTIVKKWRAKPITYPMTPLNVNAYYVAIYERVAKFLTRNGFL